jgi:hypothetical protein
MFRMLRRYRKIKGDSRLTATGDRGHHSVCNYHAARLLSSNSLYLLLTPFIYRASEACESLVIYKKIRGKWCLSLRIRSLKSCV